MESIANVSIANKLCWRLLKVSPEFNNICSARFHDRFQHIQRLLGWDMLYLAKFFHLQTIDSERNSLFLPSSSTRLLSTAWESMRSGTECDRSRRGMEGKNTDGQWSTNIGPMNYSYSNGSLFSKSFKYVSRTDVGKNGSGESSWALSAHDKKIDKLELDSFLLRPQLVSLLNAGVSWFTIVQ